uniref:Uncharacterized protein n=1 Tax=viral metagenome TaxID=1070528 RepID=A0A6C0JQ79_9ZZZZ
MNNKNSTFLYFFKIFKKLFKIFYFLKKCTIFITYIKFILFILINK